jgi:hypothetical protein
MSGIKGKSGRKKGFVHHSLTKDKIKRTLIRKHISPKPELWFKGGDKHPNWKGGITQDERHFNRLDYKFFRSKVFERDNWTCQTCGNRGGEVKLEIHHKKGWKEYPKLRFDLNNGVTLCENCHKMIESEKRRLNKK